MYLSIERKRLTWQKSPFQVWFLAKKGARVKFVLKSSLLAALFLVCASALPAQRFVSGPSGPSFGGGYGGYGGYGGFGGYGGYPGFGWGGYGFGIADGSDFCMHHPQEHPPFGVSSAHGDPDFEPSQFMDYDQALALGKKILEEQAKPQPSLGEIARRLRAQRRKYVPPPAPNSGAAAVTPEGFVVIQDANGTPLLCRSTDSACRNTA